MNLFQELKNACYDPKYSKYQMLECSGEFGPELYLDFPLGLSPSVLQQKYAHCFC